MTEKVCRRCKIAKPLNDFAKHKRNKDGLQSECRMCGKERHDAWRSKNDRREYYRQYDLNRSIESIERRRIRARERYDPAVYRRYQLENPEMFRAYAQQRKFKLSLGMSKEDRMLSIAYRKAIANDPCFFCGKRQDKMHDDHYYPISKRPGDHWWRLVRACMHCNDTKKAHCGTWFILRTAGKG